MLLTHTMERLRRLAPRTRRLARRARQGPRRLALVLVPSIVGTRLANRAGRLIWGNLSSTTPSEHHLLPADLEVHHLAGEALLA